MTTRRNRGYVGVVIIVLAFGAAAQAAPPAVTTITVPDLDCPSCAKKVAAKLQAIPGVAEVKADVGKRLIAVTPKANAAPSPRLMWEAVEAGGKEPSKLHGPGGTFTAKPKS